jgi:anti-anti-sigma regulatory factor
VPEDRFPVTWSGRTAVVAVPAELDLTIADGLRDALLGALNADALGLVVDLTATTFCDSAGTATTAVRPDQVTGKRSSGPTSHRRV